MKTALVTTCLNEEKTISKFLSSLKKQSRKSDEIVIVDAGSSDRTFEIASDFKIEKVNIKVIRKKGNRSTGRNEGIKHTKCEIIAVTDVGCELSINWFNEIIKPFEDSHIDVVAGYYKPITYSVFEECLSTYTCVMPDRLDGENYLPSSRSIAFRRKAWEKVGGYPEKLDTCEDLVFARKLKQKKFKFFTQMSAVVYWPQRHNIFEASRQFFSYAKGDGEARYWRRSTPFLFIRYTLGVLLVIYAINTRSLFYIQIILTILILYCFWAIWKNYKYVRKIKALVILPLLQIVSDFAVLTGTMIGFMRGFFK